MTHVKKAFLYLSLLICTLHMNVFATPAVSTGNNFMKKFNSLMNEYKPFINTVCGLVLLTNAAVFIFHVVSLNKYADHPIKRAEVVHNLLISGLCLAIQGSISLFISFYLYFFL